MVEPDLAHATWKKSAKSGNSGNCVECAAVGDLVAVRNSSDRSGPTLIFAHKTWLAFLDGIKSGEFDRP
jgi:predicted secreted Zn-dependent protease